MKRQAQRDRTKKTVLGKLLKDGHETWRVAANGKVMTIRTKRSSVIAMDAAMVRYERALKRLANR